MAKISIALNTTDVATGKKLQKTLTDINAAATSEQIKTFAQALNNLTTNNYVETNRIEKTNVDTEEAGGGGSSKPAHTLTVTRDWWSSSAALSMSIAFTYDGNLTNLKAYTNRSNDVEQGLPEYTEITTGAENTATLKVVGYQAVPYGKPVILYAPETDDYAAFIWTAETPESA